MTLRKLLYQAGMMSRLINHVGVFCKSSDAYICVDYETSYDGNGPCYNFYPDENAQCHNFYHEGCDDPVDIYYIPETGKPDSSWTMDLESEDWFIDSDDIEEFKSEMVKFKNLEESLCTPTPTV